MSTVAKQAQQSQNENKPSTTSPNHEGFYDPFSETMGNINVEVSHGSGTSVIEVADGTWDIDCSGTYKPKSGPFVDVDARLLVGEALSCTIKCNEDTKKSTEGNVVLKNPTFSTGHDAVRIKIGYFNQLKTLLKNNPNIFVPNVHFRYSVFSEIDVVETDEEANKIKLDEKRKDVISIEEIKRRVRPFIKTNTLKDAGVEADFISCSLYGSDDRMFPQEYKDRTVLIAGVNDSKLIHNIFKDVEEKINQIEEMGVENVEFLLSPFLGRIFKGYINEKTGERSSKKDEIRGFKKEYGTYAKSIAKAEMTAQLKESELYSQGAIRDIEILLFKLFMEETDWCLEKFKGIVENDSL